MEAKIVIGANYGDEGKGFCVSQLTKRAKRSNNRVMNILFNGGPQRGHTVDYTETQRHIFHHFGAGTLDGADTYFASSFIVNPMVFVQEFTELGLGYSRPMVYVNPQCRLTTPWDMMANQIIELGRAKSNKHGTCGYGVWETVQRYKKSANIINLLGLRYAQIVAKSDEELFTYLTRVRDIAYQYLSIPAEYYMAWYSENTVAHFISDIRYMQSVSCVCADPYLSYDTLIFEGGQGLGLDFDVDPVYATASKTGSAAAIEEATQCAGCSPDNIEVIYVTRNYLTRHGEGPLPGETATVMWNSVNETNQDNPWQGHLRVGKLNLYDMFDRIDKDSEGSSCKHSLFVTHLNEPGLPLKEMLPCFMEEKNFYHVYTSDSKLCSTILTYVEYDPQAKEESNIKTYETII